MDPFITHTAMLIPSDGRIPSLISLTTSPTSMADPLSPVPNTPLRMPHPEVYMEYILESPGRAHENWKYHIAEKLEGMMRPFGHPYVIFYPTVSRDGMQFPINQCVRAYQGSAYAKDLAWRGNLIVGKYRDSPFSSMVDIAMSDFPIIKNYLMTHGAPQD